MGIIQRFTRRPATTAPDIDELRTLVFRHAPQVVWTTLRGETVVFDIERGKYESLNEVATDVWLLIANGATLTAMVEMVRATYALPAGTTVEKIEADMATLLQRLLAARIVTATPIG